MSSQIAETPNETSVPEQIQVRRDKREAMLAKGVTPYPVGVPVTDTIAHIRQQFGNLVAGDETDTVVGVAGRVIFLRNTGKLCFVAIQDGAGNPLQIMVSLAEVGEDSLADFKTDVDLGDHLFAHGKVISSKRGELSILADEWSIAAKALRPLPVLHAELAEDTRVRERYADLIVRPQARSNARTRIAVVRSVRDSLAQRDFLEIETPMLQTIHGGAAARPFSTHMNAFDMELYLRIAPELYLKRAVVGGIDRVFEINRNFRNEGADSSHSPEFAMLEAYEAYGDYNSIADLTHNIIVEAAKAAFGTTTMALADGTEYELGGEWKKLTMYESLSEALGESVTVDTPREYLASIADARGVSYAASATHGKLVELLWEELVGSQLYEPTFVRDFPVETSPLVKQHRDKPGVVEKWDLYIRGFELATGYSELNDPVIQRERFEAQAALAASGDDEAMPLDEDFLRAMEYAMPPTGGMGMGIDRLLMALTGLGIRETILFPLVKPLQ